MRAFSMVELLVVIGIIAVLLALLLPSLSGAMRRGRETRCLANCQQLGVLMAIYAQDNQTWYPVMPVPPGSGPVLPEQARYGGVAGLFSLDQVGDGTHTGFTGGQYSDGSKEPLLASYVDHLGILTCPSDRQDRFYGMPYTPSGNMSYAAAVPLDVRPCGTARDIVSYRISYIYFPGAWSGRPLVLLGDECNGPDLNQFMWYGDGATPPGSASANSTAAGASGVGEYGPADNHGVHGGNFAGFDGRAVFVKRPRASSLGFSID
jgi:prepilin-type N-terminal cleavage/methylation domain-containing protein